MAVYLSVAPEWQNYDQLRATYKASVQNMSQLGASSSATSHF
jgi:hypothetical protein